MVALHSGSHVLAVFPRAFAELVDILLHDLSQMERISFKSAGGDNGLFLSKEHVPNFPKWEALFFSRLGEKIAEVGHLLTCDLDKAEEIERFLPDVLEGYRGNRIGEFAFFFDEVASGGGSVVTLVAYDRPTAWQRVTKSERDARQRVLVPVADIERVSGTSLELLLTTTGGAIRLRRDGSITSGV
jgi:hypothetical protein